MREGLCFVLIPYSFGFSQLPRMHPSQVSQHEPRRKVQCLAFKTYLVCLGPLKMLLLLNIMEEWKKWLAPKATQFPIKRDTPTKGLSKPAYIGLWQMQGRTDRLLVFLWNQPEKVQSLFSTATPKLSQESLEKSSVISELPWLQSHTVQLDWRRVDSPGSTQQGRDAIWLNDRTLATYL